MPFIKVNKLLSLLLFCLFIGFTSCSEFIEYPLEKESISLLAPSNDYSTSDSLITFWWSTHQDAKFYRLQIAQPDFETTNKLIMDSVVTTDKLEVKLHVGTYSWRVRPENYGSAGLYTERVLQITKEELDNEK